MPPSGACSDSERGHTGESDSPVKRVREAPAMATLAFMVEDAPGEPR